MGNEILDSMKQKPGPRKRSDFPVEGFFFWFWFWFCFVLDERKWREREREKKTEAKQSDEKR